MEFYRLLPEIFVLCATCMVLLVDLYFPKRQHQLTYGLTQLAIVIAFVLSFIQLGAVPFIGFHGNFVRDNLTTILELVIYLTTFITFVFSRSYILDRGNLARGEFYLLGLFSMLGMMVLVSAHTLLTLYLGLELLSLPLYAMIAMYRENARASEAAIKYFVMGALASGFLLYGMALIFGATGSINLHRIALVISTPNAALNNTLLVLGLVFIVIGFVFKLGGAPFHMWVPDVYQGAPTAITTFVGSAPKVAAFGMTVRLLAEMLPALQAQWQPLLMLVAILSMGIGNLLAISQSNIKRMLAYSGIAQMGYMILGLLTGTADGYAAALFYVISYSFMAVAAFSLLVLLSRQGFECEHMDHLRGLNSRSPWLAFMMMLIMFSMAGIPPMLGFFAKVGVLEALIDVHLVWLAVAAIIFAIIGLYYYLRVVKVMYFESPTSQEPIRWQRDERIMVSVNSLALLFFGLFPGALFTLCHLPF